MHIIHRTPFVIVQPIVVFAHRHDELPWFRVWFTVSTIVASIVFNMGIFFVLVLGHMGLDTIKYRTLHRLSWRWTILETLRESLVDIFFIVLGLFLALAFHHAFAIGGLGKLAEAEILFLNFILRVGPRLKIAEHILEIVTYWKHHFACRMKPRAPLTKGEKAVCIATLITGLSVLLTPVLTSLTWEKAGRIMKRELTPRLELSITRTIDELQADMNGDDSNSNHADK
jgi:hypothetical protein